MATATKSLPKIGTNYPLPDTPRGRFAQGVALRTGLNPWVIYAWTVAENSDSSVQRRPYNFLNFKSENGKGAVLGGVKSVNCDRATDGGCFPGFGSVDDAVAATVAFINAHQPSIRRSAGKGAGPELQAIGHSGWGTSYQTLWKVYSQILVALYKGVTDPAHDTPSSVVAPGAAGGNTQNPLPGGGQLPDASGGGGFTGLLGAIGAALGFIFNPHNWFRVGVILFGGVLVVGGAFVLARGEVAGLAVGR
jgi:hypothetical protein